MVYGYTMLGETPELFLVRNSTKAGGQGICSGCF